MPESGAGVSGKQRSTTLGVQAEDVEQVCAAVAVHDRDAHLRHDLGQAGVERLEHLLLGVYRLGAGRCERDGGLKRKPRADRSRAVADQHGRMVDVAAVAGFDDQASAGAQTGRDQCLVDGAGGHRHGNRKQVCDRRRGP